MRKWLHSIPISWGLLFMLFFPAWVFAQKSSLPYEIKGRVVTLVDGEERAVHYASLLSIVDKAVGCVANENGYFSLRLRNPQETIVMVSALGYADTLIRFEQGVTNVTIRLPWKPVVLPEVTVTSRELEKRIIGSEDLPFVRSKSGTFFNVRASQKGASVGNAFEVGGLKGFVDCVGFYTNNLETGRYMIVLYGIKDKLREYRLTPLSGLSPIIDAPLMVDKTGSGWKRVKLAENVFFEGYRYIAVSLTKLDTVESSDSSDENDKIYQYDLVHQNAGNHKIYHFYIFGESFAVFPPKEKISSLYVELLVEK